jgi:four helix bundle protein
MMSAAPARRFIRSYEDLDVYQRAMEMLPVVHRLALTFPDYERYDLANQLRRASKSVPANIAEGYAKKRSPREFQSFLTNAMGSAAEMEVHLKIALKLGCVGEDECNRILAEYEIIGKQLYRLIEHWRSLDSASPPTSHLSAPPPEGDQE